MSGLKRNLDELAQREATNQQRIEDLSNRLFLLEDKVDTNRVAVERRGQSGPRLPVVRIKPQDVEQADDDSERSSAGRGDGAAGQDEGSDDDAAPAQEALPSRGVRQRGAANGRSVVSNEDVYYRGAATGGGPRPVLRIYGAGSGGASVSGTSGPDPSTVREKLPAAPLAKAKVPVGPARAAKAQALPGAAAGAQAMHAYGQALDLYKAGRQAEAAKALRAFVVKHAGHAYADNALYWLGECHYDLKQYRQALDLFRKVVQHHPSGNKAPDALLKMGYCYMNLNERTNARSVLAQVVEIYPQSKVARLASHTLSKLQ
ncbi:MAG: tol-pal system protein YbgF [Deltaproteobacteria bacterium]|nr:tol-pal system protein YbgF [Deltaproteobacteria bacterium]